MTVTPSRKVTMLRGWCIPAQGKDYAVREKDAMEISLPMIEGSELINDVRDKTLRIPAADPGNIVGYEYEVEDQPYILQSFWTYQHSIPVRESHFSIQLPAGWAHKEAWLNSSGVQPASSSSLQWSMSNIPALREEEQMPPLDGVEGMLVVSYFPPGENNARAFTNWEQMAGWYLNLTNGRHDSSPEIKQQVTALTASAPTQLAKMKLLAQFVQEQVRYVAIELGIGGYQPHPATSIFSHRYGDCKDKATLMISMLHEIGVDAYYVPINAERGAVGPDTPANAYAFNHVIVAVKLSDDMADPSLVAILHHPKYGQLLFFDPTNHLTPFGEIGGYLQGNYGLLVTPTGGELLQLPTEPATLNSIQRTAKLTLDSFGTLYGSVVEVRTGDRARVERGRLLASSKTSDQVKPIESLLSSSLTNYHITAASIANLHKNDQPFGFDYSFQASNYAKSAGDLLLVRPRVLGIKTNPVLETKETRHFPIEFAGTFRDTDNFEITIPPGYTVDELTQPVDVDYDFASYHASSKVDGNVIRYTRTFEMKEVSVPVSHAAELKKFYRIIADDERNMVVLKPVGK